MSVLDTDSARSRSNDIFIGSDEDKKYRSPFELKEELCEIRKAAGYYNSREDTK